MTTYISVADTAKLIRATLKTEFPGVKFSVRSKSYSMSASIRVIWTDGPAEDRVKGFMNHYEGSSFDGMIDLKSSVYQYDENGEKFRYGSDYVFCERNISPELLDRIAEKVAKFWDVEKPTLNENGWYDYNANHVYLEDHNWDSIIDKIGQAMAWVELDKDNNLICEHDRYVHGLAQWLPSAIKGDGVMAHSKRRQEQENK